MSTAWTIVELAARPLTPDERDAILGDSVEVGESAWQTLCGVLGLILRRQFVLWKSWRPWFAAFGFALPCSLLLAYVSISVTYTSERLLGIKISHWAPTGHEGFGLLFCHIFLLITWAWTSGFAIGSISPRTLWWSVVVAVLEVMDFGMHDHGEIIPLSYSLLFVAPAIWGVLQSRRSPRLRRGPAFLLAVTMTILTAAAWFNGALWLPNWLLLCPAWYLVSVAHRSDSIGRPRVKSSFGTSRDSLVE